MSGHDDEGFERLLRGETPGTSTERDLGAFVDDVREAFPAQPLLAEDVHLARIAEAAHLLADNGDPVARPVSNAAGRAGHASGLPKRRGTMVRVPAWKSLTARVVAGLVVLMSMFGGMAFAGALPGGVHDKVADAVVAVVDLPSGEDEVTSEEPEAEDPVETEDPAETEEPAESDDQGEDGDDQGEDSVETEDPETEDPVESDDQGEDGDDQGEDGDDQGEDESESTSTETETGSDDQGDDTQDATETDDQDQDENE